MSSEALHPALAKTELCMKTDGNERLHAIQVTHSVLAAPDRRTVDVAESLSRRT